MGSGSSSNSVTANSTIIIYSIHLYSCTIYNVLRVSNSYSAAMHYRTRYLRT